MTKSDPEQWTDEIEYEEPRSYYGRIMVVDRVIAAIDKLEKGKAPM